MKKQNYFSDYSFPNQVFFHFKKLDDGQYINMTFNSDMKMNDFLQDVIEKCQFAFNISPKKTIEIIEERPDGAILDEKDETLLKDRYQYNYKSMCFYIGVTR